MNNTEEDTFRKLSRPSFAELNAIINNEYRGVPNAATKTITQLLRENNWSSDDYTHAFWDNQGRKRTKK